MKPRVYIDGSSGTTGLQIYDRLAAREDIELLLIDEAKHRDTTNRARLMNTADIVFLCLPDAAAVEAVELVTNPDTRIIDASTAHRVSPDWVCHATGFISIVYPLIGMGLLPMDTPLACLSLTGYSGGGKSMIGQYEQENRPPVLSSPALYGLLQNHKHLPEMKIRTGLSVTPVFVPVVDDYYKGMASTVSFHMSQLHGVSTLHELWQRLRDFYVSASGDEGIVRVEGDPTAPESGVDSGFKIYANMLRGRDSLSLIVCGNDERFTVTALFDNLGKGASGAAVQNMNIMLGFDETKGLNL